MNQAKTVELLRDGVGEGAGKRVSLQAWLLYEYDIMCSYGLNGKVAETGSQGKY